MKGMSMMVMRRSRRDGRVLVDMTAGTEQPKPISMGTILLPERPILRRSLSMTKATLAIYPPSSRMERKKKRTIIMGMKLKTLPTPVKMPSTRRDFTAPFTPAAVRALSTSSVRASMPLARRSCRKAPMTLKVR